MIRVRVTKVGERHPMKAWRVDEGSWNLAKEVSDYVIANTPNEAVIINVSEVSTGKEIEYTLEKDFLQANAGSLNGPILWAVKETVEALEGARDIVQERINKGGY